MPQVKNPFLHQHDHDHDHHHHHGHDDGHHVEPLDPAQQSLSDALRVSFGILKIAMVVLFVAYLFSGIFTVNAQEQAVRLRFGEIVGDPGQQVYDAGWYFGLPYPIEQVIKVPVNVRQTTLDEAFWYEATNRPQAAEALNPERDGSLITGDANIVHGKFVVNYAVDDAAAFVQNVGDLGLADELIRSVAEQGILHAVAQTDADAFITGRTSMDPAEARAQEVLDAMQTGLLIGGISSEDPAVPQAVAPAFQAVVNAESQRAGLIEQARQEQSRILGETAGEAALPPTPGSDGPLLELIREYEVATQLGDTEAVARLDAQLDQAFRALEVQGEAGPARIGAQAAEVINEAYAYSTGIVESTKAEANTFRSLLAQYRDNPRLLRSRLWQNAREQILTGDVETIYSMPGEPYIVTNRDPAIARQREQQRLQQEREAREQQQQ